MNTSTTVDPQEAAQLEKMRAQVSTDLEALRQKEASLKEYEQRLRLLVDHAHQSSAQLNAGQHFVPSGPSQAELDSQWEKYERAHALLEAARRGLCDDRMVLKDREEKVTLREVEVARRESWAKIREQEIAAKVQAQVAVTAKPKLSFSAAQFLAAKNLFSMNRSH